MKGGQKHKKGTPQEFLWDVLWDTQEEDSNANQRATLLHDMHKAAEESSKERIQASTR